MKPLRHCPTILLVVALSLFATACDERDGGPGAGGDGTPVGPPVPVNTNAFTDPNVGVTPPPTKTNDLDHRRTGHPGTPGGGPVDPPVDPPDPIATPPIPPGPDVFRGDRTRTLDDWTIDIPPDDPPPPPGSDPSPRPEKRLGTPQPPIGSPRGLDIGSQGFTGGGGGEEPVPEPSTIVLFLVGATAALLLWVRRR